ncbi:hypothetical protein FPV67DRAFT_1478153 [Lyophyllum atratum]|nr:hypothetical protein FPV67DRAFT_1478153 [Lyophyllum atratum]
MTISSATATSSSQHMAFSGRRPALIAVILGATFGAVLICVIISLSLCYWRRIRRKRILLPYPFLQKSMKSPSDMAHSEGAFAKSRIVRESPLPDRFSKDEQSRVSQDNTVVNPDSNDQEAVELGLENERLRQENEFLRLMTHQASKPTKGGPLHGSTLLSRTKECRVS